MMKKTVRSPLFLMALTIFIDFAGFGLILPLLPFWAEHLGANPTGVGLILTIYALAQFIFTPVLGALSDRYGRKPIIVGSLVIEAFSFALSGLAGSLAVLLIARFIGGLGASNIGSAQAVVADVTPPEGRARGMGMIGAAIGLGFVVGPAIGGLLAPIGPSVPFLVAMAVAIVNALLVISFLPETHKDRGASKAGSPVKPGRGLLPTGLGKLLRNPAITRLIVINLLFTMAFTAMEAVYPLFSQHVFGWTAKENGYVFTYVGLIVVLIQGGLVGQLVKRFGERTLLIAGLVMLAAGLALLPLSTSLALMLVALGILSAGNGAVTPTTSALLSLASPREAQGETLGFAQGIAGLGRVIGPLVAGSIYTLIGPGAPFLAGSVLVIVAMLIALPAMPLSRKLRQNGAIPTDEVESVEAKEVYMARDR
jgi:DHA1 family tetracycline resistance protein-like MFS transporter